MTARATVADLMAALAKMPRDAVVLVDDASIGGEDDVRGAVSALLATHDGAVIVYVSEYVNPDGTSGEMES